MNSLRFASATALDDARSLLADGIHRQLDVLGGNKREDGSIDDGQFLDAIEEKLIGHTTAHILR